MSSRRDAVKQIAILVGATLSAPTLAALARADGAWAAVPEHAWKPRSLTVAQSELVAALADGILPATDTPGARAAGVHQFIDALLTDYYPDAERTRFLEGLRIVDSRSAAAHRAHFIDIGAARQAALIAALDTDAYRQPGTDASWFWLRLKELTLTGYYTSRIGATLELHGNPWGAWKADIPYSAIGRSWS